MSSHVAWVLGPVVSSENKALYRVAWLLSRILATQELFGLHWTMTGAGAKARHAARVHPSTGVAFTQMALVKQQEHVRRRLIVKERALTQGDTKIWHGYVLTLSATGSGQC